MARRILAHLGRARDPGLLVGCFACLIIAAAMVFPPAGWATAGVSLFVMDLALEDRSKT